MNICILIGTFRSDVAYRVMTENIAVIKGYKISLNFLAEKLLERNIINEREMKPVIDEKSGLTADQKMDSLMEKVLSSIDFDGQVFGIILEILKEKDTRRAHKLARILLDHYNEYATDM